MEPFVAGTLLGPYRIEGVLGAGGMGKVYKAVDTRLNRSVAIKTSDDRFTERFALEARAISALNHPHICTLYDVGQNYLVMELIEGETLAERLRAGPIALDEALAIAAQIADALEAAHEQGIIHRDLEARERQNHAERRREGARFRACKDRAAGRAVGHRRAHAGRHRASAHPDTWRPSR